MIRTICLAIVFLCTFIWVGPTVTAQDSSPCPKHLMYVFGGTYYYSTVNCSKMGTSCSETSSNVIKGYSQAVVGGCRYDSQSASCKCNNDMTPTVIFEIFKTFEFLSNIEYEDGIQEAPSNSVFLLPSFVDGEKLDITNDFVVKVVVGGEDRYFRCFHMHYVNSASGTDVAKDAAILLKDGDPDPRIVPPEKAPRTDGELIIQLTTSASGTDAKMTIRTQHDGKTYDYDLLFTSK